jgi:DNA-directed RNA polymerase subunit A'
MEPVDFYWFFRPEDIDEEGNLLLDISTGRIRHKWFPTTKASAIRFIKNHPDAAGLRAAHSNYLLARITMFAEDVSEKYPDVVPEGVGKATIVLKTPLKATLPMKSFGSEEVEYYNISRNDLIYHSKKEFSGLQMGLMSDEEITKLSVMEVTVDDSRTEDGTAIVNGVSDLRMGSTSSEEVCTTCKLTFETEHGAGTSAIQQCQGHFGRIDLPISVPKVIYMGNKKGKGDPNKPIMKILNRVCHHCSRIRTPQNVIDAMRPQIEQEFLIGGRNDFSFRRISNMVKDKIVDGPCPHCGKTSTKLEFYNGSNKGGVFNFESPSTEYSEGVELNSLRYDTVRAILEKIPDDECAFYGMDSENSRPENLFTKTLLVAPNTARPMNFHITGQPDDNDLTKLYSTVVYASNKYRELNNSSAPVNQLNRAAFQIYLAVSRIFDNHLDYIGSGGPSLKFGYNGSVKMTSMKGILNRLEGKKGRFRNNLQSKYVESVAYSVISPDSNLSIDEVGVPLSACKEVSYPISGCNGNLHGWSPS